MFKHILVPLDGSTRAETALPIAARIAHASNSSVILLQVVNIPMSYGYGSGLGMGYGYAGGLGMDGTSLISDKVSETEEADATTYLTRLANSDLFAGISVSTHVVNGLPVPQILALANQQSVDLLVLCSHGRTGFTRWVLGSVAQKVIHHSHIPVLVLREAGSALPVLHSDPAHPLCVVVTVDGSPLAETALLPAAHLVTALAQHTQATVHLLHVLKPSAFAVDAEEVELAQAYLQRVRERLLSQTHDLNLQVTWSVMSAQDVAETIVTNPEKGTESTGGSGCDLLAMATHGRGGVEHWVMGSVTERVLGATTLPMLVVRPPHDALHS